MPAVLWADRQAAGLAPSCRSHCLATTAPLLLLLLLVLHSDETRWR